MPYLLQIVADPGAGTRQRQSQMARLWTYVRDDRPAGDTTRRRLVRLYARPQSIHPQTHMVKFEGVLQADAYAGFNALFSDGTVREAACWAHARRKFHNLHMVRATTPTTEALSRIAERYVIEAKIRASHPTNNSKFGKPARVRCLTNWNIGCLPA